MNQIDTDINLLTSSKQNLLSITNILDSNLISDGSISNLEFNCLNNVSSNIQSQFDNILINSNLTGLPVCPAAIQSTNSTQVPSTAFVKILMINL